MNRLRHLPLDTIRTLKDEEAEKKQNNKGLDCHLFSYIFHSFVLLHPGLYSCPDKVKFCNNFSQGELNFRQLMRGNSIFCCGESRKKSQNLFFFLQIGIWQGEILLLGNFPRRNSHFPQFLSGETSSVVSDSSYLPKWKQTEKIN